MISLQKFQNMYSNSNFMHSGLTFEEHELIGCAVITRYVVGLVMHFALKLGYVNVIVDWSLWLCKTSSWCSCAILFYFYMFQAHFGSDVCECRR